MSIFAKYAKYAAIVIYYTRSTTRTAGDTVDRKVAVFAEALWTEVTVLRKRLVS